MAHTPDIIQRVSDILGAKGVGQRCPMCSQVKWMIQDDVPYSRVEVAEPGLFEHRIFSGIIPTYWLYCGNCGFVAQFMKSVADNEGDPRPEEPPI